LSLALWSELVHQRTDLLAVFIAYLIQHRWGKALDTGWSDWDVEVHGHVWTVIRISTTQEDHGSNRHLVRVRCRLGWTTFTKAAASLWIAFASVAAIAYPWHGLAGLGALLVALLFVWWRGARLAGRVVAGLESVAQNLGMIHCAENKYPAGADVQTVLADGAATRSTLRGRVWTKLTLRWGGALHALKRCRRLIGYATAGRRGWMLIVAVTLITTGFGLLQPWPTKVILDHVLGQQPMAEWLVWLVGWLPAADTASGLLVWMVLATVAIFFANSAADIVLTRTWVRVGQRMVYQLAGDLFAHLQRRSLLFHSRNSVGDSMSRITGDSWCVYKAVESLLFTPVFSLLMVVGIVVVMVELDPWLTLLAVGVAPFMAGTAFLLGRPIRRAARTRREIDGRLQSHVQRTLSCLQVVRAFAQEEREDHRFADCTGAVLQNQRRLALATGLYSLVSGLIMTLGTGAVLWTGAHHVLAGQLSIGSLVVFLAYLASLQKQLKSLTTIYSTLQEISVGVERVLVLLEADLEVKDRPGAALLAKPCGHVRLENVTFGYEPGRAVLHDVSLEVLPGETVAIVGPTGAGKTTLVSLVARFFDPWEGQVRIDGHDVRDLQLRSVREQVALVLQEPFLFPFTIAENIAYGRPGASRLEVETAARAARLHDFILKLPEGYDTVIGERGINLSGGERQRLSIARALLKDAPILILDEPTSALDAHTEKLLLEALQQLVRHRTTFIIAHRLSTVRSADRIVVLREGRLVESGTHAHLMEHGGHYARLHETQTRHRPRAVSYAG
jgi:ATP-binding cassette subfamily B protein/subfamily B ATP-binding cassette protein MsbA